MQNPSESHLRGQRQSEVPGEWFGGETGSRKLYCAPLSSAFTAAVLYMALLSLSDPIMPTQIEL